MDTATSNLITTIGSAIAGIVAVIHFVRLVQINRPARAQYSVPLSNGELAQATREARHYAEIKAVLTQIAANLATLEHDHIQHREEIRRELDQIRSALRMPRLGDMPH